MLSTLARRIRHDEEVLRSTSQSFLQSAGIMMISMLAFLAVCLFILFAER